MMEKFTLSQTGGTAFPCAHEGGQKGMTLRDYFAAQAMQGMCSTPDVWTHDEKIAAFSYAIADAMLRERKKEPITRRRRTP